MSHEKENQLQIQEKYLLEHHEAILEIAKEVVARRIMLKIHVGLWIGVNLLLLLVFSLTNIRLFTLWWSIVPWGFAVLLHFFNYKVFRNGWFSNYNEYTYAYSVFLYITINILLLIIDIIDGDLFELNWFSWAFMGLSIALGVHTLIFFIIQKQIKKRQIRIL